MIVAVVMVFMGTLAAHSPLGAQEAKTPAKEQVAAVEFWQTAEGQAKVGAAVHVFAARDPCGALGVYALACQELPPWRWPIRDFWLLNAGLEIQAAMHVFGSGTAYASLASRMLASEDASLALLEKRENWPTWHFIFDEPLPLYHRWLSRIRDRNPLPQLQANELKGADLAWYLAYNQALDYSNRDNMDLDKFKKGAIENKMVVFPDLLAQPELYRGKIITAHGELIVVRQKPAPRLVGRELTHIYTGYIVGPTKGAAPYTIVFTQLPEEIAAIPEKQWEKLNLEVTFSGYFLSLVRFPADKGSRSPNDVISPYLVGRSLIVQGKAKPAVPDEAPTSYSYWLIASTVGSILGIVVLGAILNIWLRRGDRRIQSQLANVRDKHNPFNLEPADPEPPRDSEINHEGYEDHEGKG
jgi:hypothetical protein